MKPLNWCSNGQERPKSVAGTCQETWTVRACNRSIPKTYSWATVSSRLRNATGSGTELRCTTEAWYILVRNSLRPSLIHATTVSVVEHNSGKIWCNTTGFLHFPALCLLCRSGHWRGVHSYGCSEVLLVWWVMEYQIKDNPISLEICRKLFSGSKPDMFDCCLQDSFKDDLCSLCCPSGQKMWYDRGFMVDDCKWLLTRDSIEHFIEILSQNACWTTRMWTRWQ